MLDVQLARRHGTILLLLSVVLAPAAHAETDPVETFAGSCHFHGSVRFDPPLGPSARQVTATADATGTCDGTLQLADGSARTLRVAPVRYRARSAGTQSCAAADAAGTGSLDFGDAVI